MVRETRHLWVGNLPHTIREERILDHFKRYGKVQSVKILPKKEDDSGGACATVAFIDIKSAAKAHNADNKIEDRTLKTDYYEPPASSTASSAIYIHERDDALVRNPTASYSTPRTPRYGLSEERNYERPGHYYGDRESYLRRPLGMGYHDEDNYQGRAKSRDRYSRSNSGNTYTEGTERNQNHFRSHNTRQHFDPQRYPVGEQYSDEREPAGTTPRLNRRTNNNTATPVVASVASPTTTRSESRPRRTKRRSPSRTPSGSRSNSGSRSRSRSSSGSRSSSSSSKLRSTSSDSSGRSRSPSKSRSPAASYGSQSNAKGSRLDRPSSAIANPSSTVCYLPSAVNTSAINCTSNNTQGSTPMQGCPLDSLQNNCDKEEKRPLGICVRNLPVRSTDTSLKDGLFHEYKKHGKVTMVKVIGQGTDRYAVVCFKKPEDVDKALEVSKDKLFFGCKIEVTAHEGLDAEDNEFRPLEAELDEFHPKATRTLFIGNLEKDITTAELRKHFEQFGEIIEIDIKKQGSATSYAFIQYSDIASVVKAMRKLDGENLGANRIKLGFGKSMPTNCVWLDGIVDSVSDKFLTRHFNRFGIVIYTVVDREKGHALVFYESVEFAQIAVSEMRGRILQGKKLQVDFASRECQTTFFDKLEMTGQMIPGDGTRPWERRERRGAEFEVVRSDDREARVGFENRAYTRYEGQPRANRGNFRGNQRSGFSGRGRGQNFSGRYEYHDEFGERRHRYNSREESGSEATLFDGKLERLKYNPETPPECPNRKRNKLRNSISDQESHHSQSPPRSRHQSRSTSPVSKERKSLKDRLHHRIKSPSSHNSSLVNSPCRDALLDDLDTNSEYRDSRSKSSDAKMDDIMTDLSYTSPRSSSEKEGSEKMLSKSECDSFRSRSSLDAESADEAGMTSDQLGQMERKKRLLASSSVKSGKDTNISGSKSSMDKTKPKNSTSHNSIKSSKVTNCFPDATVEELKLELENVNVQYECAKEKSQNDCANTEMKFLKKKQVQILHLLEQLHEGVNSSDNDCSVDDERLSRKKHRLSSTCLETNSIENDITKSHTKDDCGSKLCKSGIKDPTILSKLKKMEAVEDSNCVSLSLDSFIFSRKHLDPRKGYDQHSVLAVNSLPKCRRISVDNDSCLPNTHGTNESFLCVSAAEVAWKKHSLSDVNFSENENDSSMTLSNFKVKDDHLEDETVNKKLSLSLTMRSFPDGLPCHEKRERDISPLSLPLPKFAASLRSPKSSPSILTSPKSTSAHSPRAGLSPSSYATTTKNMRISDLSHDILSDKKVKDIVPEDKVNGATTSPPDTTPLFFVEPQTNNDTSESVPSVEPIQSPKSNCDKIKEHKGSSGSEHSSPVSSPNRPSIEDRIKALDEKFNAWSGSTRTASATVPDVSPSSVPDLTPKCSIKRSRFSYLTDTRKEPSEIVKSLLARSTIFDQDSKRLQHIDEKYEPLNIKMDLSPKVKPAFRTKAAAKEFSTPITPTIQSFSQSLLVKSPATVMVAQGIMSPPATPQSATSSILSPVTPVPQYTQLPPSVFTPCSPRSTSFSLPATLIKTENVNSTLDKELSEQILKSPQVFNSVKAKVDPNFHANSAALATSLKSSPLTCPAETPSHGSVVTSVPIKKEPASPTEAVTENVCKVEVELCKVPIKKEVINSTSIPIKKENTILSIAKEHSHFNSIDQDKKEFCDSKDPRLSFNEEGGQWRENVCKDEIKVSADSSAKPYPCSDLSENSSVPAAKKRVSSIDSNESDSSKSLKSLESSRDSQEVNWTKQDKLLEPEPKRPKLNKSARERSVSPPVHQLSKKSDKKEKTSKTEKNKSAPKPTPTNNPDKVRHEIKCNNKSDYKDKPKSDHKSSKDEKRSKSRDSKESGSKSEARSKPQERRNSDKDGKNSSSNNPSNNKPKKDTSNKSEKSNEKKSEKKSTSKSKSSKFDFQAFMDEEPVYFSMYDKVKARSSKSQTLKHQTTSDLESVRQKFSKLKQSRAKREEKSKSVDQDSDKDSDSSHHSSESDSEAKRVKVKQQRKRKLVIESSSDEDQPSQETNSQSAKTEKDFQSESATDSDFDYNVSHRQSSNKSRRKKTELLDSDSSDSDSNFPSKSQHTTKKKSTSGRSKARLEKSKKAIKSEDDMSDVDSHKNQKNKEKDKSKKVRRDKDVKVELEVMECDIPKRLSDEAKNSKKKSKDVKSEPDLSPVQKKFKPDHGTKEKASFVKDKKVENNNDKLHSSEETEKHKPYSKKRKKSKKMSRNKDKRTEKSSQDTSRKQLEESDTKSSLPILLSPKPSSPLPDKQLSPPRLDGMSSDNDYKSDDSYYGYENPPAEEMEGSREMWKHGDTKSDTNSEKSSKNKKKENVSKSEPVIMHSPEQDSSLPSFFDKLSDITDSETGREVTDFIHDVTTEPSKQISFSVRKDKDTFVNTSPHKSKHEKHEEQPISKQDSVKYSDNYSSPSKEERRKKKSKKQCKERKKKTKDDTHVGKDDAIDSASVSSPKPSMFETVGDEEDSRLSDIRLDEEIAEEARRLEQELLAASEETSTFGDDGPAKREEKLNERRFEEEAAKETRRLEAELLSTGRDSWHMKEKEYDSEANSGDLCDDKHASEMDSIMGKDENIFAGLELHSSVAESSQNETDVFLSGHSESDPYKIDDKDVTNEIEDQRKIEDDLAVSALLQEMHCGEIPAPELTKEADYLHMEAHPDDTMNYLLPEDDGENSLHIADSSPDNQGNESQEAKLEASDVILSPSSNSEPPPALEISNVEDSLIMKIDNENQPSESLKSESGMENQIPEHKSSYEFTEESSLEQCESKPPVIDLPNVPEKGEQLDPPVSPKPELSGIHKKRQNDKPFRIPSKPDALNNDDTDDECSSDLTENQLTHFEDITNDTADSKDDDNPPILLPVQSPPNLLPVSDSKEQMEPLDKVTIDDNQCLDRIIGKAPVSGDSIFDKVTDLDKQIGDIINSITELKSKKYEGDGSFRIPGSHDMSDLSGHNITDPLGLNSNSNLFEHPKAEEPSDSHDFDPEEILKPSEKEATNPDPSNISINYTDESINNKFEHPQSSSCVLETSILNYSDILSSTCDTNVIQSSQKMDSDAVTISITEKNDIPAIEQFDENRNNNVSDTNHASSDSFLLELFGPKSEENFKIETADLASDKDKSTEFEVSSESKNKMPETDLSTLDFGLQHEIKPLFEIPEVNEQNEATEFNQEIFERPSDVGKDSQIPRLLSFSSEHLFPDNASAKKDDVTECSEDVDNADDSVTENQESTIEDNCAKPEAEDSVAYPSGELESNKETDLMPEFSGKFEETKEENLNIEESLESKMRPVDAESVCSDTTDITIPETKIESESSQTVSVEEQVAEDVCPTDEIEVNIKPKVERPRRGRRPKTRRYVESFAQKQEPPAENPNPPVNMRITRRGSGRPTSSERTRRSLRSDTSESITLRELNENKQTVEESGQSEVEEMKKDDDIIELPIHDSPEVESAGISNNSRLEIDSKVNEKPFPVKTEEPKKRRGRRKKNSGDRATVQTNDKMEHKSEEPEPSKDFNRPKESRLLFSLSDRDQKSTNKESATVDVYEFIVSSEDEATSFESVKEKLHENTRANTTSADSKHDNKLSDPVFEKKEKTTEDSKSKAASNEDRETASKEYHIPTKEHYTSHKEPTSKEHHVSLKETASKEHHSTSKDTVSKEHHTVSKETSKEPASKEQQRKRSKLSMVIRIGGTKDGHDGIAEVIKTSEAIDESKSESTKPERNTSSKHDTVPEVPYNGPCTRKSTRLMNQALSSASISSLDKTIEDVVKGNFKSTNSNSSSTHSEPVQTRATRRSRSSRRSEESLPLPSESSDDVSEDKNKNEPVFFIPDNTVKEVLPETKKSASSHVLEMTPASDTSTASESDKNNDHKSLLRSFRILRSFTRSSANKQESNKNASHSNVPPCEQESHKKDSTSYTSAEDKFDALQKESKEVKEKEIKTVAPESTGIHPQFAELKVALPRMIIPTKKEVYSKPEKVIENEEDSEYRSSPAALIDPVTGFLVEVKASESFPGTPNSSSSTDNKNSNILVSDASSITSVKSVKVSVNETPSISTVIQESSKTSQPSESTTVGRVSQSLRSRQIPASAQPTVTVQSSVPSSTTSDSSLKLHTDKTVEHVKLPAKKSASSAVPVLTIANSVVSSTPITSAESVSSSLSIPVSQSSLSTPSTPVSQPPVITSLGTPVTTTLTQSSNLSQEKKEEVQTSGLSKISHSSHRYQPPVRAIVTAVVTQVTAGHSVPLPSSVQTKCSINTTSTTSSSVLITPELPVVYSSANIPPTSVSEHISNISCKPVSLPTPMTSEQSNIPLGKETHVFTSSTTPVTTTWTSSKVSSNRITDVHGHASTIQTSSNSNPVFSTKSESRSSKVAHAKNTSAFTQQPGFPLSSYEASVLSSAHNISGVNTSGGMIAELLQNPQLLQQTHKEYFAAAVASGQLQERMQGQVVRATTPVASSLPPDIAAARRGNPTPPHTPTPPVTSANHSPLLIHPTQQALIVPPHPSLQLHPSDLNPYVHHLFAGAALNHYASPMHSEMRAQQEAQARAAVIGMNPRYAYSMPPTAVPTNSFRQPTDSRLQPSVMDAKSEQKLINDLSKIVHETRSEEKSLHPVKSGRSKKEDKEIKVIHSEREDHESRHIPAHEKIPSTSAITPHSLRQQQHAAHYSSTIRQLSPRLTVSPHDQRHTDSPIVVANPYATGQSRVPQISISGQVDDHKAESLSLSSHHYKNDATETVKPPVAHQTQPSTIPPYHSLDAAVHPPSRQQMHGVLQIGSTAAGHIDGRSSNPAHSPSSHIFKKDSNHSQTMSLHTPATDKRVNSEHSKKVVHARTLSHQGSSISPGPAGMAPAHSPLPWHMQPHNSHSSIAQSPHVILPTNEQSSRRVNSLMTSQLGSEVPVHAPPPAHAMSQPSNVPRTLSQTPPHASQVPSHDAYILRRYPVMWQGLLALKNDQAAVQMHFVSGNPNVARASLPPIIDGDAATVRISQRMRLDPTQLDGVFRKIQLVEEHCILMALPCGKDQNDVVQQSTNLKSGFINYLMCKNAAGIVNAAAPGSQQPAFVIHIFPSCEFIESNLSRIAPSLLHLVNDISHLVIIIATV